MWYVEYGLSLFTVCGLASVSCFWLPLDPTGITVILLERYQMGINGPGQYYYKKWKYTPAVRSKISSKLIFASCLWYSDRAHYELCVLIKDIGRRLPLQLQSSYQGQQDDFSQSVRGNYKTRFWGGQNLTAVKGNVSFYQVRHIYIYIYISCDIALNSAMFLVSNDNAFTCRTEIYSSNIEENQQIEILTKRID